MNWGDEIDSAKVQIQTKKDSKWEGPHAVGYGAGWLGKYCGSMQEEKTGADEERLQKKQDLWPSVA